MSKKKTEISDNLKEVNGKINSGLYETRPLSLLEKILDKLGMYKKTEVRGYCSACDEEQEFTYISSQEKRDNTYVALYNCNECGTTKASKSISGNYGKYKRNDD